MHKENVGEEQDIELAKTGSLPPEIMGQQEDLEKSSSDHDEQNMAAPTLPETGPGISYRRLVIIMIGLCLTIFLTALDQVRTSNVLANGRPSSRRRCRQSSLIWEIPQGIPGSELHTS
jgi:hypothetical protein